MGGVVFAFGLRPIEWSWLNLWIVTKHFWLMFFQDMPYSLVAMVLTVLSAWVVVCGLDFFNAVKMRYKSS
jgi:hypothetical protein